MNPRLLVLFLFAILTACSGKTENLMVNEWTQCPDQSFPRETIERILVALPDRANRRKFILWEDDYGNKTHNPDNVRVVYSYGDVRYTLWYSPTEKVDGLVLEKYFAVWERPEGSSGPKELDTYTDYFVDGCVNVGYSDRGKPRVMSWNELDQKFNEGARYHKRFQVAYNAALIGLMRTLGIQS